MAEISLLFVSSPRILFARLSIGNANSLMCNQEQSRFKVRLTNCEVKSCE